MQGALAAATLAALAAAQDAASRPSAAPSGTDPAIRLVAPGASEGEPLVVLVHGLAARKNSWDSLRSALSEREPRLALGEFRYQTLQPIGESARQLAGALAAWRERPVYLVGHSLGGVVAREVVEDPTLDPGNVRLVVLLGSPADDALLAPIEAALAAADAALARLRPGRGRQAARALLAPVREAVEANARALRALGSRPRNPRVEYRAIVGTRAPLPPIATGLLRLGARAGAAWLPERGGASRAARAVIPPIGALESGSGDGVVSRGSAAIPGVEPVLIGASHADLPRDPRVLDVVVPWLRARRVRDLAM